MTLGKRAQQFQSFLDEQRIGLKVVEMPESTRTAEEAARALGCSLAQIVKSLVFREEVSGTPVMVLASGTNRVDPEVIGRYLEHGIAKADADFVKQTTGYSIGGVPPFGHKHSLTLFVDEDLLAFDEIWAAAGTPHAVFMIPGTLSELLPEHTVVRVS